MARSLRKNDARSRSTATAAMGTAGKCVAQCLRAAARPIVADLNRLCFAYSAFVVYAAGSGTVYAQRVIRMTIIRSVNSVVAFFQKRVTAGFARAFRFMAAAYANIRETAMIIAVVFAVHGAAF